MIDEPAPPAASPPLRRRLLASLDRWQREHRAAAVPVAVARKFTEDRASMLAALVAHYAFLSIFPLMLVLVSTLGFVLDGDPSLREDILDTAFGRIPVVGAQLRSGVEPLTGSTTALVIGLAGALWAALGVTVALVRAFDVIWDVPRLEQSAGLRARLAGLIALTVFGAALIASTVLAGIAAGGSVGPAAGGVGAVLGSLAINVTVLTAVFWILTARPRRPASLLPGAVTGAVGLLGLQALGGWFVDRAVNQASDTYGVFAVVIGLLSWFWLVAHVLLISAELNVVLHRRLWPRSLTGELEPADRLALRRSAQATRRDRRQEIEVTFTDGRS